MWFHDQLEYAPDSPSCLRWKVSHRSVMAGDIAGSFKKRYWVVRHRKKQFPAHRIVWEMFNGQIPDGMEIDHIDRDSGNNRIENLRLASRVQNMQNTVAHKNNTSGVKNVSWSKQDGKWRVQIRHDGKYKWIGYFSILADAAKAAEKARAEFHGKFARTA